MSQTSLPSHTGPMARRTRRRSGSFFATKGCMAPAPRSKPSRSTYMVSMKATRMNQSVSTFLSLGSKALALGPLLALSNRAVGHLAYHQHEVEEAHDEVHPREADQSKEHVARGDQGRHPL